MAKQLSEKQLHNRLNKKFKQFFTPNEQETVEFLGEQDQKDSLSWFYRTKKQSIEFAINKKNGVITACTGPK